MTTLSNQRHYGHQRELPGKGSSMTVQVAAHKPRESISAESLYEAAEGFVPEIRRRALKMERSRRLDDDLVDAMDAAGLFSVIVPKLWGGAGLGPR